MNTTMKTLYIAALAVVGAMAVSCTNQLEEFPGQDRNVITLTTTVSLGGNPNSKALSATGVKTFAVDDQIAVVYKDEGGNTRKALTNPLTATDIHDEGKKAVIRVTLDTPAKNGTLRYIYPAAMAKATIATNATIDDAGTVDFTRLEAQDGKLETLASNLDLAVYDGTLTADATLPASVTLANQLAIGEFTIKNADASVNITSTIASLTVTDGTNTYEVTPEAPATRFGNGPVYVAMKPVTADKTLTFTINNNVTPKVVTGKALAAGSMYPYGLKFGSSVDLNSVTTTDGNGEKYYEAQNGDILSGQFAGVYGYVTIADGATVTLNGVDIKYKCDHAIIHCLGDANIVLADGSENMVDYLSGNYPAVFIPEGKTLTISGTGTLFAYNNGGSGGAGIGGGNGINCGNIIINGGIISAEGSNNGAGIGSGNLATCGSITMNGGVIQAARGGKSAAGIGSGYGGQASCEAITINGGQIGGDYKGYFYVGAIGGQYAAGIGSGRYSNCEAITIGAGITFVTATRGSNNSNSPIGKGNGGKCGTVTIDASLTYEIWDDVIYISPTAP